jgi:crossover junction endodeoxyribonuclease RuvC
MKSNWLTTENARAHLAPSRRRPATLKTILGIDPGSQHTGFGVIQAEGDRITHVAHGVVSSKASSDFNQKLKHMGVEVSSLIKTYKPDIVVVERIFLGKNADSAFKLGHVRGVCLFGAALAGAEIVEYAARSVKKGITGNGAAEKEQVQMIVFASLGIKGQAKMDASDALALAFFHARNMEVESALSRAGSRRPGNPTVPRI